MFSTVVSIDQASLPNELLAGAKRHAAIDFCDHDDLVSDMLQDAIGEFERVMEMTVSKCEIALYPDACDFIGNTLRLPVTPVHTAVVKDAAEVQQAGYTLRSKGVHGTRINYLIGPWLSGMSVTLQSGYEPEALPPPIREVLFRMTATLYEYREIYITGTIVAMLPGWSEQALAGFWLPRL